jgi:co-chaperonin GroES (HSP10)
VTAIDPYKIRPSKNVVLVCAEQRRKETNAGLILLAETQGEKLSSSTCRVISFGVSEKTLAYGLEVGHRVLMRDYVKHAIRLDTDEKWPDGELKHYALVYVDSITAIVGEETDVWVYNIKEKP